MVEKMQVTGNRKCWNSKYRDMKKKGEDILRKCDRRMLRYQE